MVAISDGKGAGIVEEQRWKKAVHLSKGEIVFITE